MSSGDKESKRKERSGEDESDLEAHPAIRQKLDAEPGELDASAEYAAMFGDDEDDDDAAAEYEETSNRLIREDISSAELNGGTYTFHLQLLDFLGGAEGVGEVNAKVFFSRSNREEEKVESKGEEVGYLSGFLLPRPMTDGSSFFEMADSVSDELAELTGMFCNRYGHLTRIDTGLEGKDIEEGGLLQIYSMEIKGPGHAGTCDLGLRLVHEILGFLKDDWNIALMVPCLLGVQIQQWPDFHNRLKIDPNAAEHTKEQTEGLKEAHLKIKRHFARMGFVQAGRNSEHHHAWYLTASSYYGASTPRDGATAMNKWKSKSEIKDLDIFVAPDAHVPEGVDAELNALVVREPIDTYKVRDLIKTGASIHGSRAIFVAAADNDVDLLKLLVEELGGDANEPDENGNIPLHVAAMMLCPEAIDLLVQKGAKKDAKNDKGHSPLQTAQESVVARVDESGDPEEDEAEKEKRCLDLLAF